MFAMIGTGDDSDANADDRLGEVGTPTTPGLRCVMLVESETAYSCILGPEDKV